MIAKKRFLGISVIMILAWTQMSQADEKKNYLSVYGGRTTERDLQTLATLRYEGFINSYIGVVALGRELYTYKTGLMRWEIEGQVGKHWGYQHHWETNALVTLRWLKFPWDHVLDTSFAVGDGISYASQKPKMELDKMGKTSNVLNYLMFEWECIIPNHTNVSLFARIHHRSGVYGLINNISGGSNMLTGGFRIKF